MDLNIILIRICKYIHNEHIYDYIASRAGESEYVQIRKPLWYSQNFTIPVQIEKKNLLGAGGDVNK